MICIKYRALSNQGAATYITKYEYCRDIIAYFVVKSVAVKRH